MKLQNFVAYL